MPSNLNCWMRGDEIVVSLPGTDYAVAYCKPGNSPQPRSASAFRRSGGGQRLVKNTVDNYFPAGGERVAASDRQPHQPRVVENRGEDKNAHVAFLRED